MDNAAIGIDLGTTYSCVAVYRNGKVEIIPNSLGDPTTPSIVSFSSKIQTVGEKAVSSQIDNPKNTIFSIKRLIGRTYEEEEVKEDIQSWPFKVIKSSERNDMGSIPKIQINLEDKETEYNPEQISSFILSELKKNAEDYLGQKVTNVVITVPYHFKQYQKKATIKAAELAGFEKIDIINEPTAAAMAFNMDLFLKFKKKNNDYDDIEEEDYKIGKYPSLEDEFNNKEKENKYDADTNYGTINVDKEKTVLVFDLGGGTFDVSLVKIHDLVIDVKQISGDAHFGGEDFDNALVDYCINKFNENTDQIIVKPNSNNQNNNNNNDNNSIENSIALKRLKLHCEHIKRVLSKKENTRIEIDNLLNKKDFSLEITRKKFERIIKKQLEKCEQPIKIVLENEGITADQVDEILLVGGSTKMPAIRKLVENYFNKKPNCSINPDEAVAYGAALEAAKLAGVNDKYIKYCVLKDITPFSYGIAIQNPEDDPINKLNKFLELLDKQKDKNNDEPFVNPNDILKDKGKIMHVIIPKGSPIPIDGKSDKNFKTIYDNQKEVNIEIYEGESTYVADNKPLKNVIKDDLPLRPAGHIIIGVKFTVNTNGILTADVDYYDIEDNKRLIGTQTDTVILNKIALSDNDIKLQNELNDTRNKDIQLNEDFSNELVLKNAMEEFYYDLYAYKNLFFKRNIDEEEADDLYTAVKNYSQTVEDYIDLFIDNNKISSNEYILEKVFYYLTQLLYSYKLSVEIKGGSKVDETYVNEIIQKCAKYFEFFSRTRISWLPDLKNIFTKSDNAKIYYYNAIQIIKLFVEKAKSYLQSNDKENTNKKYAKEYFNLALSLFEKFKIDEGAIPIDLKEKKDEVIFLKKECENNINLINAKFIEKIEKSLDEEELIQIEKPKNIEEKENIYLTLDRLREVIIILESNEPKKKINNIKNKLKISNINNINNINNSAIQINAIPDDKINNSFLAICYANIINIKYNFLKDESDEENIKTSLGKFYRYLNDPTPGHNLSGKLWVKDLEKIKKKIEEPFYQYSPEELVSIKKAIENKAEECVNNNNLKDYVIYILDNHPYKDYQDNQDNQSYYIGLINENDKGQSLKCVDELINKYHPKNYVKDYRYEIMEQITI